MECLQFLLLYIPIDGGNKKGTIHNKKGNVIAFSVYEFGLFYQVEIFSSSSNLIFDICFIK